jgi:ABC-2 type transport system ATP-binding protein
MLEAKQLVKRYGTLTAVDGLSASIQAGETFGLLGPNGAGKSTTIGMLVGLIEPDDGEISVGSGADQGPPNLEAVRKNIGIAPQSLSLYETLTARENLDFFGRLYNLSGNHLKQRIDWAIEFSGLEDRQNDRVETFSGGMKRRLNIAVAMIHEPTILLLDEPTVGVDPQSRNHIFERIEALQKQGLTILYTTHYMEEAQRLCDRVAIMDQGKILACNSVDGLLAKHGGQAVVTATFNADSKRDGLGIVIGENQIRFEDHDPIQKLQELRNDGYIFDSIQIANSDLEAVFLKLTGRELRDQSSS